MRRLFLLVASCFVMSMVLAPAAFAQQGPSCPGNQVNVLTGGGDYICVPPNVEDQTPAQIDAVVNDPRSNAETPINENQGVPQPGDLTPAQAEASGNAVQPSQPTTGPQFGDTRVVNGQIQEFTPDGYRIVGPANTTPTEPMTEQPQPMAEQPITEEPTQRPGDDSGSDGQNICFLPEGCDIDGDGVAEVPAGEPVTETPEAGTGMTNLPDTGGLPLIGLAGLGGIALLAGGLLLRHRLS